MIKRLKVNTDAWCAHTMIYRDPKGVLLCCDCGRQFDNRQDLQETQDYETKTGKIYFK